MLVSALVPIPEPVIVPVLGSTAVVGAKPKDVLVAPDPAAGVLDHGLRTLLKELLGPDLLVPHVGVPTVERKQFGVSARFDESAGVEAENLIGVGDRREAVTASRGGACQSDG